MSEKNELTLGLAASQGGAGYGVPMAEGKAWLVVGAFCMFLVMGAFAFAVVGIALGIMWGAAAFATLVFAPCAAFILWARARGAASSSHETLSDTHA